MTKRPERSRTYHGLIFDSTYWDAFKPRPGDIVVSTSAKAGTNKRWHEVLTEEDIALYQDNIAQTLEPAAARWLEEGRLAYADPRDL